VNYSYVKVSILNLVQHYCFECTPSYPLIHNGPAVWLVAVCACPDDRQVVRVAVACFLPSRHKFYYMQARFAHRSGAKVGSR